MSNLPPLKFQDHLLVYQEENDLPFIVLPSTEKLLKILFEPPYGDPTQTIKQHEKRQQEEKEEAVDDDEGEELEKGETVDDGEKEATDDDDVERQEEKPEEKTDNEKPSKRKGKEKDRPPPLTTPGWATNLTNQPDLSVFMRNALHDIVNHKDTPPKKRGERKNEPRLTYNERRIEALEHTRNRLQRQKSKQSSDEELPELTDEAEKAETDESLAVSEPAFYRSEAEAWQVLVKAWNSLSVLTPILTEILLHEERGNKSIKIGKHQIRNRRKPSCWLLGRHVYGLTTQRQLQEFTKLLCDTLWKMGVFKDSATPDPSIKPAEWIAKVQPKVDERVQQLLALYNSSGNKSVVPAWTPPADPLPLCFDETKASGSIKDLEKLASKIDQELGLLETAEQTATLAATQKSVKSLEERLTTIFTKRFSRDNVKLRVYGSCLSGLNVGATSDVDINLEMDQATQLLEEFEAGKISAANFDSRRKRLVYNICRCLEKDYGREFLSMQPVARARVPVVKGQWTLPGNKKKGKDASGGTPKHLDFDICLFNGIAYTNSSLLKEYTLFDHRVKPLIRLVKQWVKAQNIASAANGFLSSYAWTNLVVYYLQAIRMVPNLQDPDLMAKAGVSANPSNPEHNVKNLSTFFLTWEQAKALWTPPETIKDSAVSSLFYGFIRFYARDFPSCILLISVPCGPSKSLPRTLFSRIKPFWSIEDPFETHDSHCPHDLNHADERGAPKIWKAFHDTEVYLTTVWTACPRVPELLWPKVATPEPNKSRRGNGKGGKGQEGKERSMADDKKGAPGDKKKRDKTAPVRDLEARTPPKKGSGKGKHERKRENTAIEDNQHNTERPVKVREGGGATEKEEESKKDADGETKLKHNQRKGRRGGGHGKGKGGRDARHDTNNPNKQAEDPAVGSHVDGEAHADSEVDLAKDRTESDRVAADSDHKGTDDEAGKGNGNRRNRGKGRSFHRGGRGRGGGRGGGHGRGRSSGRGDNGRDSKKADD